jgi:hypothetical protein
VDQDEDADSRNRNTQYDDLSARVKQLELEHEDFKRFQASIDRKLDLIIGYLNGSAFEDSNAVTTATTLPKQAKASSQPSLSGKSITVQVKVSISQYVTSLCPYFAQYAVPEGHAIIEQTLELPALPRRTLSKADASVSNQVASIITSPFKISSLDISDSGPLRRTSTLTLYNEGEQVLLNAGDMASRAYYDWLKVVSEAPAPESGSQNSTMATLRFTMDIMHESETNHVTQAELQGREVVAGLEKPGNSKSRWFFP